MKSTNFTNLILALTVIGLVELTCVKVQAQWSGVYGNEWLTGKYGQPWVRIGVGVVNPSPLTLAKGIYRISMTSASLPSSIKNADKSLIQLWHRGKEVAVIKADNNEILFYGVPNDGKSDELLYRPTSSRVNPYYSMYGDESAYFLTVGTSAGLRAVQETLNNPGAAVLDYHIKTDSKNYQTDYSHATWDPMRPVDQNSFFEDGKSRTGSKMIDDASNPKFPNYSVQLVSKFGDVKPSVKVLIHGRTYFLGSQRKIHIYVGKDAASLRDVGQVLIQGFTYGEYTFDVETTDLDNSGKGVIGFSSDASPQGAIYDAFSVTYYNVTYQQQITMEGLNSKEFIFPATAQGTQNKIVISNPPAGTVSFYDISDPDKPRVIIGTAAALTFSRPNATALTLFATNQAPYQVSDAKITQVTFTDINKAAYNYLIVSNNTLLTASEAFRKYRAEDMPGKVYKAGVFNIADLYNQFNYGEPSPVAIRRFADYMVSDGDTNKYLLLMGKSITRNDRMVRELPDEVPTVGFPGSDVLLVDGLGGKEQDVPTIPVGRIPAISNAQALGYLEKVKSYEGATSDLSWRKKVVHISGGKSLGEVSTHSGNLALAGQLVTGPFEGSIDVQNKSQNGDVIQQLDISAQINAGVGMLTYFGHSAPYRTDYNFGYVSDNAKGYTDNAQKRYALMFYNGCDILNVFSNVFAETVNVSTSRPQSLDWLLNASRGAVAVFGNSWAGYNESCNEFLQELYPYIFAQTDGKRPTLGQILRLTSKATKSNVSPLRIGVDNARIAAVYSKRQAQIHQTVLLGDPALRVLVTTEGSLPVNLVNFSAKLVNPNFVEVAWQTVSESNNSHFIVERSYNSRNFESIGMVEGKGNSQTEMSYVWYDNNPLSGTSYYRLTQVDGDSVDDNGVVLKGKETRSSIVTVHRSFSSSLVLSPNPSSERMEIKLDVPVKMKTWNLIDMNGRTVIKDGKGDVLSLRDLSAGEYILEVHTDNGDIYTKKLVRQ